MTMALEGGEGSASRPGLSLLLGKTWYPLYRRLGGPQGRSGQVWKISPPLGFDPWTIQPVASRYTDYATWPTSNTKESGKVHCACGSGGRLNRFIFRPTIPAPNDRPICSTCGIVTSESHMTYFTGKHRPQLTTWEMAHPQQKTFSVLNL
jgi:hypothetical protein